MVFIFGAILSAFYGFVAMAFVGAIVLASRWAGITSIAPWGCVLISALFSGFVVDYLIFKGERLAGSSDPLERGYYWYCLIGMLTGIAFASLMLFLIAVWIEPREPWQFSNWVSIVMVIGMLTVCIATRVAPQINLTKQGNHENKIA